MRQVEVLGPVRVGGASVTSPTQLTLLSVLAAAAPGSVPFHRLIDAVWDDPPPSVENSLHSHLTRLRKALGPGSLVREGDTYRLCSPTDAARFVDLLAERSSASVSRRARLTEALALWRGPPFGERGDHPFVHAAARALLAQYGGAQRELARLDLAAGHPGDAIARLRRSLDTQPLDEESWALLVEALDAGGHRADALRAVQEAIATLAEVGLDPSGPLRAAEGAVLQERLPPPGSQVPRTHGPLIGRDDELATVAATLETPGWITLIGPGGAGKTRLALDVAATIAAPLSFSDLTEISPDEVPVAVARAVGAPLRPPYVDRVISHIGTRPVWLILDCCELVDEALAGIGARLMDGCPGLRILATSRSPIGVPGERLIEVPPLDAEDAGALLRLRVETAGAPAVAAEMAVALCRSVDCLPLNVEMLAGALRSMSPTDLLDAVRDPVAVLTGPRGGLTATVERSMSLLSDEERTTFEQLCLFRGPFVPETAQACAAPGAEGSTIDHLRSLRDRSLISPVQTASGQRLRILDTVRAVGRASLEARKNRAMTEGRYTVAFATRAEQISAGLRTDDEVRWLEIAETETSDLRAAHRLAVERGDADAGMRIPAALFPLVYDRLRADLAAWADESLDAFGVDHPLAGRVLAVSALGAMHVDQHERAWTQLERAGTGDEHVAYRALVAANLHLRDGALAATEAEGGRVVEAARAIGEEYLAVIGHVLRGLGASYQGHHERAEEITLEVRRLSRQVGAPTLLAYADYLDGEVRSETQPAVALELLHRAHDRAAACRSALAEGVALVTITTIRGRSDDPAGAAADFGAAIRHWQRRGDWNLQWSTLRNFVEFLERVGNHEEAAVLIGAIEAHGPDAFGVERVRFTKARESVDEALGPVDAGRLHARGRSFTDVELLDFALAVAR